MVPAVLREAPQFRRLFLGQVLSVLGDAISTIVLPFAVLAAGGGVAEVGLVAAARFAPFLLLSLVGGVVGDRADRRRVMIASDAVRGAAQAVAGILVLTGDATTGLLALTALAFGAADAFFTPAFVGLLPRTLPDDRLVQPANALRGLSLSAALVGGPALAGLLVATVGAGGALLVDAATFAVSIGFLLALRPVRPGDDPAQAGLLEGLRGGWRAVRSRRWLWTTLLALAAYHVVVLPAIFVLGPVLAERDLGGAEAWAAVVAAFGAGAIVGDLVLLRWRPRRALRVAAAAMLGASAQAAIIGSGLGLAGIAGLEFLAGIATTWMFSLWETTLQEHVPDAELSRVASYDYLVSVGLMPLGFAVAGPASAAFGLETTLLAMSVLGWAAAVALLAVRAVRDLPRGEPSDPAAFWDARAREDALYFVDSREPYGAADSARFWRRGAEDLDRLLAETGCEVRPGDVVVDLGCGVGRLTRPLARRAAHVHAVDVSAAMLERARAENPALTRVEWHLGDGRTLPLPDASADGLVSLVVLQHVPDPATVLGYVAEMGRVLRPGGWAAFHVSTDPAVHAPRTGVTHGPRGQDHPAWLGTAVTVAAVRDAAEAAGLTLERVVGEGTQFCLVGARAGTASGPRAG